MNGRGEESGPPRDLMNTLVGRLLLPIVDAQHMLEQTDGGETLRERDPAYRGDRQIRPGGVVTRRPGAEPPKRKRETKYPVQPAQVRCDHDRSRRNGTAEKAGMCVRSAA